MIFGRNRLEQAILGLLRAQKLPKMAIIGCFSQFATHLPIFLAGTRWNSPLKVKSEAMLGLSPAKKSHLRPPTAFKMTKNSQFWPFQPV